MTKLNKEDLMIGDFILYEATVHLVKELHSDKVIHKWANQGAPGIGDGYCTSYDVIEPLLVDKQSLEDLLNFELQKIESDFMLWKRAEFPGYVIYIKKAMKPAGLKKGKWYWDSGEFHTTELKGVHHLQHLIHSLSL